MYNVWNPNDYIILKEIYIFNFFFYICIALKKNINSNFAKTFPLSCRGTNKNKKRFTRVSIHNYLQRSLIAQKRSETKQDCTDQWSNISSLWTFFMKEKCNTRAGIKKYPAHTLGKKTQQQQQNTLQNFPKIHKKRSSYTSTTKTKIRSFLALLFSHETGLQRVRAISLLASEL